MKRFNWTASARWLGAVSASFIVFAQAGAQTGRQPGFIATVAGAIPNGMPAVNADLNTVGDIALDASGNIYFGSWGQELIYKLAPTGTLTVVAGTGVAGYSGDGGPATAAEFNGSVNVAVDTATPANLYIADNNNCLVRKVDGATGIITTIAGLVIKPATGNPYPSCGFSGDGGPANQAQLSSLGNVAVNVVTGDLYVADGNNGRVRKIAGGSPTGTITTVAGGGPGNAAGNCQGSQPFGDGGPATSAYLCNSYRVALDNTVSPVNLFVTDIGHCAVREVVGKTGSIYDVAGNYNCGFTDDVEATSGQISNPQQALVAVSGATTTVALADLNNGRIRQFTVTYGANVPRPGKITTIAGGSGGYCGDGAAALGACIEPVGLDADASGNFFIGDFQNNRVRKFKTGGNISTIAGWASYQYSDPLGLGSVLAKGLGLYQPTVVFADPASTRIYAGGGAGVISCGTPAIYAFDSVTGSASDFAGNGSCGFGGDGTAADGKTAELNASWGLAKDAAGNVYIADYGNCAIREVSAASGDITTIAGGKSGSLNGCGYSGDGGPATKAQFSGPTGLLLDSNGNLYVGDRNNCVVRKIVLSTGTISTFAGNNECTYGGDGGPATAASLNNPQMLGIDGYGNIFISDTVNNRIREVDPFGIITTVAGNGSGGYSGDGLAVDNTINVAAGVSADPNGNLFIDDFDNQLIRWVDPAGRMVTIAGTPQSAGFSGDGGAATRAQLDGPNGISIDSAENVYVADLYNNRIRKIAAIAGYGRSIGRLIFEKQQLGTTSGIQPITLSAIGPVTIGTVTTSAGYGEVDDCAGLTLAAGQTCEIDVAFSPTKAGITDGLVTIASNAQFAGQGSTVELVGEGGGLSVSGGLDFPTQPTGVSTSKTVTLTNTGVPATLTKISLYTTSTSFAISGASTCPLSGGTLATNASCTVVVSCAAASAGIFKDTLVIASKDPSSPLLTGVTGATAALTLAPTSLAFGSVGVSGTKTLNLAVSSASTSGGSLTLNPAITGAGFTILAAGNTCTGPLGSGKSCTLSVAFTPTAVQSYGGTLTLLAGETGSPTAALTGTGSVAISATPAAIAFTSITHGTKETSDVTIKNTGTGSLAVTPAISGTGAPAFSIETTGNTCGTAIAPGNSCTLPIQFAPAAAQRYRATLTVNSNGGANPVVALSGTGK